MQLADVEFLYEDDLEKFLDENAIEIIFCDINYLPEKFSRIYKKFEIPTVCLAPRGDFKYEADLAFCDIEKSCSDTPELKKLSNLKIGFDYIVIRNEIRNVANSFIQEKIEKN